MTLVPFENWHPRVARMRSCPAQLSVSLRGLTESWRLLSPNGCSTVNAWKESGTAPSA